MPRIHKYRPISELISLKDKRAIVTGGATGLGFAMAYRFAEAGAAVIIADLNEPGAQQAAQELNGAGYQALAVKCDVSHEEDVRKLVSTAVSKFGGIDILVNNAGIFPRKALVEMSVEEFDSVMAVNLRGIFLCTREASQKMIEQKKGGCIINIASIDAVHPSYKGLVAYDTSKGGALTMTKSLARELGQHDIRVNAIAPGGIITEGFLDIVKKQPADMGRAQLKAFMSRMLLGRMGEADDIGKTALFLASELASYITGSCIFVDGGYLVS